jgi:hypothetical protein
MPAYHFRADMLVRICSKYEERLETQPPFDPISISTTADSILLFTET